MEAKNRDPTPQLTTLLHLLLPLPTVIRAEQLFPRHRITVQPPWFGNLQLVLFRRCIPYRRLPMGGAEPRDFFPNRHLRSVQIVAEKRVEIAFLVEASNDSMKMRSCVAAANMDCFVIFVTKTFTDSTIFF